MISGLRIEKIGRMMLVLKMTLMRPFGMVACQKMILMKAFGMVACQKMTFGMVACSKMTLIWTFGMIASWKMTMNWIFGMIACWKHHWIGMRMIEYLQTLGSEQGLSFHWQLILNLIPY